MTATNKKRKGPTMSATACPGCRRKGNDGRMWQSQPNKNGVYSWRPVKAQSPKAQSPKAQSPKALCKPMLYSEIRPRMALARPAEVLRPYQGFLCSEKFDGWRGIWCRNQLLTKSGKLAFQLPSAWQDLLPPGQVLDGEVFLKGLSFSDVARLRNNPAHPLWKKARFHVFDMPSHKGPFAERVKAYTALVRTLCKRTPKCPLKAVKQHTIRNPRHLLKMYRAILQKGGEGVVITNPQSVYSHKRVSRHVRVKLKGRSDEEGTVVGHNVKAGLLSSLKVKGKGCGTFSLGIGLTQIDRKEYKKRYPVGARITYSFLTKHKKSGCPREPRLLGRRHKDQ